MVPSLIDKPQLVKVLLMTFELPEDSSTMPPQLLLHVLLATVELLEEEREMPL
ncbi:hypothetical protein ES705_41268 [subsurface metagenome]